MNRAKSWSVLLYDNESLRLQIFLLQLWDTFSFPSEEVKDLSSYLGPTESFLCSYSTRNKTLTLIGPSEIPLYTADYKDNTAKKYYEYNPNLVHMHSLTYAAIFFKSNERRMLDII